MADTTIDLQREITATGILKGDGAGGVTAAIPGTDYAVTTGGTSSWALATPEITYTTATTTNDTAAATLQDRAICTLAPAAGATALNLALPARTGSEQRDFAVRLVTGSMDLASVSFATGDTPATIEFGADSLAPGDLWKVGTRLWRLTEIADNVFAAYAESELMPEAADYVQDGLIAMWDGWENAGRGTRDPSATVWKDLVGSRDLTLASGATWGTMWLKGTNTIATGAEGSAIDGFGTVEAVVYCAETVGNASAHVRLVFAGAGLELVRRANRLGAGTVWGGNGSIEAGTRPGFTGTTRGDLKNAKTVTTKRSADGTWPTDQVSVNGAMVTATSSQSWSGVSQPAVVTLAGPDYDTRFLSVRVYNRALTAEEVAANYAIDKVRFNLR